MARLLILAAGRRRYVVESIRMAMKADDSLIATDASISMPGLSVTGVKAIQEPRDSDLFGEWLLEVCERESVDGVLSLHDFQTIRVSHLRNELASIGTLWIGPSASVANTMLDKRLLADFVELRDSSLTIPTYSRGDSLPSAIEAWVIKDRLGSGSSGLVLGAPLEYAQQALESDALVAQPHIRGQEWNLDFFFWGSSTVLGVSAKEKLRMRSGETDAAHVIPAQELPFDVDRVVDVFRQLDHLGNMDIDIMVSTDGVRVVDVNPRFGGGYAFSVRAGYRAAEAIWSLVHGRNEVFPVEANRSYMGAKSIEVVDL